MDNFVHLHLHTEYSFLDGFSKVWDTPSKTEGALIKRLAELEQPACAVTDHGSTSSWTRFAKGCAKHDIKPIFGVEGYFCEDITRKGLSEEQKLKAHRGLGSDRKAKNAASRALEWELGLSRRSHFCALAMNEEGTYEIQKTMSVAQCEGFYVRPRWDWDTLAELKNCIITTACMGGLLNGRIVRCIDGKDSMDKLPEYYRMAVEDAKRLKKMFGDRLYAELMPINMASQAKMNMFTVKVAREVGIPFIMTNDSHYVNKSDYEAHDILLAINSTRWDKTADALNDPNRMRYEADDLYVKSRAQMYSTFVKRNPKLKSLAKKALDNTLEIAERCNGKKYSGKMIMPNIDLPDGFEGQKGYLGHLVKEGWKKKVTPYVPKKDWPEYKERVKEELGMITKQGFTPYFILCNKLMKWTDEKGIVRGPARGSSAGSLVAYLLDIVMVDPIPHNLLFSRFIDPNRTDYPDVDMDFEDRRRHEVVQYFIDEYGANNVAILGNNMVFKAKMALKDVARLYKVPLFETQKVCDLVEQRSGADSRLSFCLEDTLKQHDFAKSYDRKYNKVFRFATQLEGMTKQQGVHAAGVVIADGDIRKYTALRPFDRKGSNEFKVTTMDKHDAEENGLLKMDVLGLNTMAIIAEAQKLVKSRHGIDVDLEGLVRDVTYNGGDEKVYKEFALAHTCGIFQFGSPGLTRLAKQVKIDKFSEISDCTALHRPGPIHSGAMANYPAYKFGMVKKGAAEHEIIERWTKATYGLIIYQEQVMQIVRELGDFDWAQTNTVRKVMSKSGGAEYFMKNFWPPWKKGCMDKGMTEKQALKAFHRIMSFGSWAFNLSHSVSYAFVSYMCMWFKTHYPHEFVVAYLNTVKDTDGTKIKAMIKDTERMQIMIREADVNVSKSKFVIDGEDIVSGLSNVKNVGDKAVATIVENQPFRGILDFLNKIDNRACNKRSVENLIKSGAFDSFNYNKMKLLENLEVIQKNIKKKTDKGVQNAKEALADCRGDEEYSEQEIAQMKADTSPVNVGKHLSEYYSDVEKKLGKHVKITNLIDIELDEGKQQQDRTQTKRQDVWIRGVMTSVDLKRLSQEVKEVMDSKEEQRYALCNLEDNTDFIVMSFKGDVYKRYEQKLHSFKGKVLLIQGSVNCGWKKIFVDRVYVMDEVRDYMENKLPLDSPSKVANYRLSYLFQHPLKRMFTNIKGINRIRERLKCRPLKDVCKLANTKSMWAMGIVVDLQKYIAKRGKNKGMRFYRCYFEDETFQGSFMVFPGDSKKQFHSMVMDLATARNEHRVIALNVQRDMKFKPEDVQFKQVSIAIDKRKPWSTMIKKPKFKFKR